MSNVKLGRKSTAVAAENVDKRTEPGVESDKLSAKHSRVKHWLKRILLGSLALLIVLIGFYGWELYSATSELAGQHNPVKLFATLLPQPLAESQGRINILLAGYSIDDPNHAGAQLTDSIMIVSINPKMKTGILLSVPRDLWVRVPGNGYAKINAAYEYGQWEHFNQSGYFPGGIGLLEKVLGKIVGLNFNYYSLIDYAAFRDAVNAVGGININIQSPDPRGIYDAFTHLKLPNGNDHLNGQQALALARARGDDVAGDISYGIPNSDFTRTMYQRQMLIAVKDKADKVTSLFNPLTFFRLLEAVEKNVKTNLNIGEMVSLYRDTKNMPSKNIQTIALNDFHGRNLLSNYYVDGQEALVPTSGPFDYSQIRSAVRQMIN